jgi:hypothetical protein
VIAALLALLAGAFPLTVLPRPPFPGPMATPKQGGVHFVVLSSHRVAPTLGFTRVQRLANQLLIYGNDGSSGRYVVSPGRYAFDFGKYAWPPRGLNGYLNAIDLKTKKLLWRSPTQVANAEDFVMLNTVLVSGYGFTDEPDYLYAISRKTGRVVARLPLPNAPEHITRRGSTLYVRTYDHDLVVRVSGA